MYLCVCVPGAGGEGGRRERERIGIWWGGAAFDTLDPESSVLTTSRVLGIKKEEAAIRMSSAVILTYHSQG